MIVKGFDAAILSAEMHCPMKKIPGLSPTGRLFKTVYWDDATEEMRNDPNVKWMTGPDMLICTNKWTYVKLTQEEKELQLAYTRNALKTRFLYILKNYGYDAAEYYTKARIREFTRAKMLVDLDKIPRCLIESQCELLCGFYNQGKCLYKGDFNADNLQIFN